MLVGYVRVSNRQLPETDQQRDALLMVAFTSMLLPTTRNRASGEKDGRPHVAACLKALRPGVTLVVWTLDRSAKANIRLTP